MASLTENGTTWTYTYDADGMRTSRTGDGKTYIYTYNGSQLVQMTVGSDTLRFTYDAAGTPLTVTYNGTTYYYVTNIQGDVVVIVSNSGAQQVKYTYDAWGKLLSTTGTLATTLGSHNPLRYRGYVYDTETGLYYLQSRYYDPDVGRFINADNQLSPDELTGLNMFAYCGNNPANRIDPTGHDWWHWIAAVAVVAVAAVAVVVTAGGAAAAITAVASVASGVAASTTAATVAAGVFIGASTGLAVSAYSAAVNSDSLEEFADYGASALITTVTFGVFGGTDGYALSQAQKQSSPTTTAPSEGICFTAGTLVKTQAGDTSIENIIVGDYVWAWNEETGEVDLRPVVETYINQTSELVRVSVNGEEIITTPSHPFYSPIRGWTNAVNLCVGDILQLVNGEHVIVEKVRYEILEVPITVYNFEVADFHTYYVGNCAVLVHNTCAVDTRANTTLPKNGTTVDSTTALDMADDFLGPGYVEASPGRFVSSDGYRQVRMGDADLLGSHAGGRISILTDYCQAINLFIFIFLMIE